VRTAHTGGDTLVAFRKHDAHAPAVGDYYRSVGYPIDDINNGGSLSGSSRPCASPSTAPTWKEFDVFVLGVSAKGVFTLVVRTERNQPVRSSRHFARSLRR
jgi:hypothetical protein